MKTAFLLPLLLATAVSAQTGDADLRRCRGIGDAAARLACYDALPLAAAAAPTAAATADAASFGLARRGDEVKEVTSHIPGRFEGWSRDTRIRLANGQVWQVVESGRVYYPNLENPKVTVRRAALGSFLMDIEGVAATPRVRRVE